MKIIFGDATEMVVQQVYTDGNALKIKVIGKTPEEMRTVFEDPIKTVKMTVKEMESTVATYEGYTDFTGIFCYTGGILEPCLYKVGKTPAERLEECEENIKALQETGVTSLDMLAAVQIAAQTFSDSDSLSVKGIYPEWKDIIGKTPKKDYKFLHEGVLYKTIQDNLIIQEQYIPGNGTESLYTMLNESHAGTMEDPIPWHTNMRPEKDKYYVEGELIAKCIEDPGQALHNKLSELCPGRYFEKVGE